MATYNGYDHTFDHLKPLDVGTDGRNDRRTSLSMNKPTTWCKSRRVSLDGQTDGSTNRLECQATLGRLRSIKPNIINHFANQSQICQLLKTYFFLNIEKKMKSGVISGWTDIENPYRWSRGWYLKLYTVETPYSTIPYTTIFYITRWTHGPQNLQRPIRTLIVLLGFWIKQIFV